MISPNALLLFTVLQADPPGVDHLGQKGMLADRPDGEDQLRQPPVGVVRLDLSGDGIGKGLMQRLNILDDHQMPAGSLKHLPARHLQQVADFLPSVHG